MIWTCCCDINRIMLATSNCSLKCTVVIFFWSSESDLSFLSILSYLPTVQALSECHQTWILSPGWGLGTTGDGWWVSEWTERNELVAATSNWGKLESFHKRTSWKAHKTDPNLLWFSALCMEINWLEFQLPLCKPVGMLEFLHSFSFKWLTAWMSGVVVTSAKIHECYVNIVLSCVD